MNGARALMLAPVLLLLALLLESSAVEGPHQQAASRGEPLTTQPLGGPLPLRPWLRLVAMSLKRLP